MSFAATTLLTPPVLGAWWAALLVLAAAAAVPLLLHLWRRQRVRIVPWAAMRFLQEAARRTQRRAHLEERLLLSLRLACVLFILLAVLLAQPWVQEAVAELDPRHQPTLATGVRTHRILVLDPSLSMAAKNGAESLFERGQRELIDQVVSRSRPGDGFTLLTMGTPPTRLYDSPCENHEEVARQIRALPQTHAPADLDQTLQVLAAVLRDSPPKFSQRQVYLVTDLQSATWQALPEQIDQLAAALRSVSAQASVQVVDLGFERDANLAVTGLTVDPAWLREQAWSSVGLEVPLTATVRGYGRNLPARFQVSLWVGPPRKPRSAGEAATGPTDPDFELQSKAQQEVAFPANSSAARPAGSGARDFQEVQVHFKQRFPVAGPYIVQARVESGDGLPADDARSLALDIRERLPVLVVDGRTTGDVDQHSSYCLRHALQSARQAVGIKVVTPEELAQQMPGAAGSLETAECVFLCDVPSLSAHEVERLENHLRRGRGLVVFLGDKVDVEWYNRHFYRAGQGLLPAELQAPIGSGGARPGFQFHNPGEYQHPLLQAFRGLGETSGGLLSARFWRIAPCRPRGDAGVLLSFIRTELDGRVASLGPAKLDLAEVGSQAPATYPAIVEGSYQGGRVLLVATSPDLRWSSWPLNPSYMPLVREMMLHGVAGRSAARDVPVGRSLLAESPGGDAPLAVLTPDGRKEALAVTEEHGYRLIRFAQTHQSGVYRLTGHEKGDGQVREPFFAVNIATSPGGVLSESNPRRLSETDLRGLYPNWAFTYHTSCPSPPYRALEGASSWPRNLLVLGLLLLLVEAVLSWRVAESGLWRTAPVDLARGAPPDPRRWRRQLVLGWVLLVTAGLGFLLVVVFLYLWTGEMLRFLPAEWRDGFEQSLGIPGPPPGEERTWQVQSRAALGERAGWGWYILLAEVIVTVALWAYLASRSSLGRRYRLALLGLRLLAFGILLGLMLPGWLLSIQNQGHSSVLVVVDVSQSMDRPSDNKDMVPSTRLEASRRHVLDDGGLLAHILEARRQKLRLFTVGSEARFLGEFGLEERESATGEIAGLQAVSPSSRLATGLRQVLEKAGEGRPTALVLYSDGLSTEGQPLAELGALAKARGIPLYIVVVGRPEQSRGLRLHDLQVSDSVYVHDTLVFEARLSAEGFDRARELAVSVRLRESDNPTPIVERQYLVRSGAAPIPIRLDHRPTESGTKTFVLEAAVAGSTDAAARARIERSIKVLPADTLRVLYLEGYPRYEYRYLKDFLERQVDAGAQRRKVVDLRVVLMDAETGQESPNQASSPVLPLTAEKLRNYHVVIVGDVAPGALRPRDWELLADYVRFQGGGLLALAGERYHPRGYAGTALADVLPVELLATGPAARTNEFRLAPTAVGRFHPIFAGGLDERLQAAGLTPLWWHAEGYRPRSRAEVLAVHPQRQAAGSLTRSDGLHPLLLDWLPGAGRCVFVGFDETWRWRELDGEELYARFWLQTLRHLSRVHVGRVTLRLDKQQDYRQGDTIRVAIRFPDKLHDWPEEDRMAVIERQSPGEAVETRFQRLQTASDGSRLSELKVENARAGVYRIAISSPVLSPQPALTCVVRGPPQESEPFPFDHEDLREAALRSGGRLYLAAKARDVLRDLPPAEPIPLGAVKEVPLWDHPLLWGLVLALLASEWLLRRQRGLI